MKKIKDYFLTEDNPDEVLAIPELRYEATAQECRDNPDYWRWARSNGPCANTLGGIVRGREQDVIQALELE